MTADQLDLLISSILACSMSICFCIGWSCHEGGYQ